MKKENGKIYYEVGDILYYPYFDPNSGKYIIEELKVVSTEGGITRFEEPKHYQNCVGPEYSSYSNLFFSKEELLARIKTNQSKF